MTPEELSHWVNTGEGDVTVEQAREELRRCMRAFERVMREVSALAGDVVRDADKAFGRIAFDSKAAHEYSAICHLSQRLMDIESAAAYEVQRE